MTQRTAGRGAGDTRERVLTEIRTAQTPPTVDELAGALGLHRNSVRLHAAALVDAGLVRQDARPGSGRGRPRVVYLPTRRGARAGGRNYELLAEVLVHHLADTEADPEAAARQAGRTWGGRLATERELGDDLVPTVLDELGFEPDRGDTTIELRNCPFRELVDSHAGLVCSLHAGMLEGLAEREHATGRGSQQASACGSGPQRPSVTLRPFTSPTTCSVHLHTP